ncbi:unnamed protein product [Rotaria sordida]|uniref:Uncharacterized protein n=1 Tax=Rotaria sordida TaxID=392033 RepID=A0A815Y121_9BILA|nr:unnamed protein product [Rotaria sordida]CAF1678645.1 unnamed protein product [Rotaria sordida]
MVADQNRLINAASGWQDRIVHHANPNHKNHSSISALILAAELGYFECVKLHVQAGADLKLPSSSKIIL